MQITPALIKDLRERTGSGMMECKRALTEAAGDIEAAIEMMRKSGLAKADKRAGRIAAEGQIVLEASADAARAVLVEVNSETDFVAKGDEFRAFSKAVAAAALTQGAGTLEALLALPLPGQGTVEEVRRALVAKIGENINVRRVAYYVAAGGRIASYLHGTRIGVLVELQGGDAALAKDIAMHIAASRPQCVLAEQVPETLVAKERDIARAQSETSGKPAAIIDKMVEGRVKKFLAEVSLVGQPFVKEPDVTVGDLLKKAGAEVLRFTRIELGEGIEKKSENFAEEVMAQVRGG